MMAERPMLNFTLAMVDATTKIYQKKYDSLEILVNDIVMLCPSPSPKSQN